MKIEKKCWPEYFQQILDSKKTFDLRANDFDIKEGDILVSREWDPKTKEYTGRVIEKTVGYIGRWKLEDLYKFWTKEELEEKGIQDMSLM